MELSLTHRRLLAVGVAAVAAVVLGMRLLGSHAPEPYVPAHPVRAVAASAKPRLVVDVVGAVRRPGLYRLATGSRVADAVMAAGGVTGRAARTGGNLAAPVVDGEQVLVPLRGAGGAAAGATPSGPVSLSAATAEQLDTLPGIGPATA